MAQPARQKVVRVDGARQPRRLHAPASWTGQDSNSRHATRALVAETTSDTLLADRRRALR